MGKKPEHLKNSGECKAFWGAASSSVYRKNAIKGIKAKPERRDAYDNELLLQETLLKVEAKKDSSENGQKIHVKSGSPIHTARYKLKKFTDGKSPYPNHAHHMIPANAFINKFSSEKRDILWRIKYDVNNENNMIFLPATLACTKYHLLPWHQTDDFHRPYSKEVKEAASDIINALNKVLDEKKPCESVEVPEDIVNDLIKYENLLWDTIVNLGPKSINEIVISDVNKFGAL